jgi:hypothetical protein
MRYNSGVVTTIWNSIFRKVKLYFSHVRPTVAIHFKYYVNDVLILRSDGIKDHGVMLVNSIFVVMLIFCICRH